MAKSTSLLLTLSLSFIALAAAAMAATTDGSKTDADFIKTSCRRTSYPDLCFESLSVYANEIKGKPHRLAETALAVSVTRAQSAKDFVSKLATLKVTKREHEAVMDCIEEMGDTIDRLSKSFKELKRMGQAKGEDFNMCMSNVQTWTSAALTDENTCLDGFAGKGMDGKLKSSIRAHVIKVAQETSNALALINSYASKHR